ncbi:unnamed protein product, partial [marine sediment metagenome]
YNSFGGNDNPMHREVMNLVTFIEHTIGNEYDRQKY